MRITRLETTRRGLVSVHLDGEFYCTLHPDIAAAAGLAVGETTPERLAGLQRESEYKLARERALRLLSGRAYTAGGLYAKLCEKTEPDAAQAAVERMRELGLIDDADYARRFAADCLRLKGYAKARTLRELTRKGVDPDTARDILEEFDLDEQLAAARIVRRRYLDRLADEKGLRRTMDALARLGYRYDDIRAVIDHLREDEDYYEE